MTIILKNKQTLEINDFKFKCSVGKNGFTSKKKEGDKKTPKGIFKIDHLYYRRDQLEKLLAFCKKIELSVIGLMCIPPMNVDPSDYFREMEILNNSFGFKELSMGMSSDYLKALKYSATYLRIGSSIFGKRF